MLSVQMAFVGVIGAIFPISGFALYPVHVRATGFNLGSNLAGCIGGFSPLMVSAVQVALPSADGLNGAYALALVLGAAAVVSLNGCLLVAWFKPEANSTQDVYEFKVKEKELAEAAAADGAKLIGGCSPDDSSMALTDIPCTRRPRWEVCGWVIIRRPR